MRILITLVSLTLSCPPVVAQSLPELTERLAKAETLDGPMVGDGGDKSETWRTYERWRDAASIEQLREFTKHRSPIVRGYAVRALVAADAPVDFAALANEHLLDAPKVTTFEGCCKAEQCIGDVILETVRPKLTPEQLLTLAEALLDKESPLFARKWSLRNLRLRDRMLHTVRSLAENGDADAGIALARYQLPPDAKVIAKLLQNDAPFDDNAAFEAAAIHRDPSLLAPLLAIEPKARKRIESDNFSRLFSWLHAIAAQQSAEAGAFLLRFLRENGSESAFREKDVLDTMKRAIADFPQCAAFDEVRAELRRRHANRK